MAMTIKGARTLAAKLKKRGVPLHNIAMELLKAGYASTRRGKDRAITDSTAARLAKEGGAPVRKITRAGAAAAKPKSRSENKRRVALASPKPALKAAATAKRVAKKRRPVRKGKRAKG